MPMRLFESVPGEQRSRLKPLVVMLGEALEAPTQEARFRGLQRLGDVSLFIAGFFSAGFARKLVDIDYHIAMGGRAYGTLAENCSPARGRTVRQVFAELAAKFTPMVDALERDQRKLVPAFGSRSPAALRVVGKDRQRTFADAAAQARARASARGAQRAGALSHERRDSRVAAGIARRDLRSAGDPRRGAVPADRSRAPGAGGGARQRRTAPRGRGGRHAFHGPVHRRRGAHAPGTQRSVSARSPRTISPITSRSPRA